MKHSRFAFSGLALFLALQLAQSHPAAFASTPPVKFSKAVDYGGGLGIGPVATGDVNNDGIPDIVGAATCSGVPCAAVLLGNGDGTFQTGVTHNALGWGISAVAVADVNGDHNMDLIVISQCVSMNDCLGGGEISILLGNGTFQPPVGYNTGALFPTWVAVADVNHDNKLDLIVSDAYQNSSESNGAVSILMGKGDGTFKPAVVYNTGPEQASSVQVADLNNDTHPDLVVVNGCVNCPGSVSVLINKGSGTFQSPVSYPTAGYSSLAVAVADMNGDNKPDLVVLDFCDTSADYNSYKGQGVVSVLLGNGNGTFQTATGYSSGGWRPRDLSVADVNGSGTPAVVVANACVVGANACSTGNAGVLLGSGDGTLEKAVIYQTSTTAASGQAEFLAIADLNADKRPDLVVSLSSGFVAVLLNDFTAATTTAVTSSANPATVGQTVEFTATITSNPPVPDGETVTFYSGAVMIGTGTTTAGVADLSTSFAKAAKDTIKASYPGDPYHKLSSGRVIETVNP